MRCAMLTILLLFSIGPKSLGLRSDVKSDTRMSNTPRAFRDVFAESLPNGYTELQQQVQARFEWSYVDYFDSKKSDNSKFGDEKDLSWPHDHSRFDALGPVTQCPDALLSSFGAGDSEKHICGLDPRDTRNCIIISIGSANAWSFEERIAAAYPHCKIHTMDCTIEPHIPESIVNVTTFHKKCLDTVTHTVGTGNNAQEFISWSDFTKSIKLRGQPSVLKMDIEGYEWRILEAVAESGTLLPASISLELHYRTQMKQLPWFGRFKSAFEIGGWMDYMFTRGGYMLVDRHDNSYCPHCSEIVLSQLVAQKDVFTNLTGKSRVEKLTPLFNEPITHLMK